MAASTQRFDEWVKRLRRMLKDEVPSTVQDERAAVEAGTIRWSSEALQDYVNDGVKEYSTRRPQHLTYSLVLTDGTVRYDVPTGAMRIDEIKWISTAQAWREVSLPFAHEKHDDQILFLGVGSTFGLETSTVTVLYTKIHDAMTGQGSQTTVPADDEEAVLHWAAAEALDSRAAVVAQGDPLTGAAKVKRGRVTLDYGAGHKELVSAAQGHRDRFHALTTSPYVGTTQGMPAGNEQQPSQDLVDAEKSQGRYGWKSGRGGQGLYGSTGAKGPRW